MLQLQFYDFVNLLVRELFGYDPFVFIQQVQERRLVYIVQLFVARFSRFAVGILLFLSLINVDPVV
jgi:hypothetical protein